MHAQLTQKAAPYAGSPHITQRAGPSAQRCSARVCAYVGQRSEESTRRPERQPRPENVEGALYVDHTCIDCDTCRWMAPEVYGRIGEQSAVTRQPKGPDERREALQAMLACPTFSIHSTDKTSKELKAATAGFPKPVPGCHGIFHCGYHSEKSYGASSWFLQRPGGNVMIDCPRFHPALLKNIQAMGGAKYMFLTHKDDVADHAIWADKLRLQRIIHKTETTRSQGTRASEVQLTGRGPWKLPDGGDDVELIFTPGHSEAHVVLFHQPSKTMFTGDHLSWSARMGGPSIHRRYNWWSVEEQLDSIRKLLDYDFLHVLPGHGRQFHMKDAAERLAIISSTLEADGVSSWQV